MKSAKIPLILILFCTFFGVSLLLLKSYATAESSLFWDTSYTTFQYDKTDIKALKELTSSTAITEDVLQIEDNFMEHFLNGKSVSYLDKIRFYTYLYAAQRDAAFLSYSVKHHFEGDLHYLHEKILKMFYPDYSPIKKTEDAYSQKLADIVFAKLEARYKKENTLPNTYPTQSWIPWIAKPSSLYFPPPINAQTVKNQVQEMVKIQKKTSELEKNRALNWQERSSMETGDWMMISNQFLFDREMNIPLGRIILIRNLLTVTLYDTSIAVYAAKNYYHIDRPYVIDPSLTPIGPLPTSPSYPSEHAALAKGAQTILINFFPESKPIFTELLEQSGLARIISGVHTPLDVEAGKKVGEQVAFEVLLNEAELKEKESAQVENSASQKVTRAKYVRLALGKQNRSPNCCSRKVRLPQ